MHNTGNIVRIQRGEFAMPTVGSVLRQTIRQFADAGIETAQLDARLLVADVLGVESGQLIWHDNQEMASSVMGRLASHAKKRLCNEPVSHIIGRREFWKDVFIVSTDTLVPRPDSETLVSAVLELAGPADGPLTILDLGTGSGCLILSLLREFPEALGVGVDISPAAIDVARRNGQHLGLADRAEFVVSDWFSKVKGTFDIVIANPPYIVDKHIDELDPDVRDFEPRIALAGGPDGLNSYRSIARPLREVLKRHGIAAVEVGADQAAAVCEIFEEAGFCIGDVKQDLAKRDRCVLLHQPCDGT